MKNIFSFILMISFFSICAQTPVNRLSIGIIDSIYSSTLKEYRTFWVYIPDGYTRNKSLRYPVVYLLDGQGHFFSVAGMIQQPLALEDNPGTRKKLEKLKAKH